MVVQPAKHEVSDLADVDLRDVARLGLDLVMRGVALAFVQKLLGHSSIVVTQRYDSYAHLGPQVVRDAVLLFERRNRVQPEPMQAAA